MDKKKFFKKQGFTLVEALVAISIILILSSISVISLQKLQPSWRLASAGRELITNLRYAQQMAVTEQINYAVKFDLPSRYLILKLATTTENIQEKNLPNGIIFTAIYGLDNDKQAVFNPYGSVLEAGEVILSNDLGENKIIEIKPSGFVKIRK